MMWQYSRRETKFLLLATLSLFSCLGLMVGQDWQTATSDGTLPLGANSVGVFAGVSENPVNTLATQLDERARELDEREAMLTKMGQTNTRTLLMVSIMGAGLLGLILLNFYLDTKRRYSLV